MQYLPFMSARGSFEILICRGVEQSLSLAFARASSLYTRELYLSGEEQGYNEICLHFKGIFTVTKCTNIYQQGSLV